MKVTVKEKFSPFTLKIEIQTESDLKKLVGEIEDATEDWEEDYLKLIAIKKVLLSKKP